MKILFFSIIGVVNLGLAPLVLADAPAARMRGQNVAVSCFALSDRAKPAVRSLQARLEEILAENGAHVLDEAKASEMRQGYHLLSDPTAVVTAELLIELREKYQIDQVLNLYFDGDVSPGLADYFTATAQAEVRLIDKNAQVEARASRPMGVVGNPGSDAVTAGAARLNALERAMDEALEGLGLRIVVPAEPRLIRLVLEASASPPEATFSPLPVVADHATLSVPPLIQQTWEKEQVTLAAGSPDGNYAAVATYLWSQRQGSRRIYGSRIHVIDVRAHHPISVYDFSPLATPAPHEKNGKKILAVAFLASWRFLVAVNANELVLYDVERGRELSRLPVTGGNWAELAGATKAGQFFLRVSLGQGVQHYRLTVAR